MIATYFSTDPASRFPFWPLLFLSATIRLLGSDDFPPDAKCRAAHDINACLREGRLQVNIASVLPLDEIAAAHQSVERGAMLGRVVLTPDP